MQPRGLGEVDERVDGRHFEEMLAVGIRHPHWNC